MTWRNTMWSGAPRSPRDWQRTCFSEVLRTCPPGSEPAVIQAVTGSGKSVLIAELCAAWQGRVTVSTPTVALVDQLSATLQERLGEPVGRYYTHAATVERVTVVCVPSALRYAQAAPAGGLWIADEAHRTEAEAVTAALDLVRPGLLLGMSATPYRSDSRAGLTLFGRVVYQYTVQDAIRDRVVVPYRIVPWCGADTDIDTACVDMTRRATGPGIYSAMDIADAEAFAARLRRDGIPAEDIHSRHSPADRTRKIEALRSGELRALVHVSLMTEGVDLPWLRWLCLRRKTASRVRFVQEVGRVLRASPGKSEAVVYDPWDLFGELQLTYDAVLGGDVSTPPRKAKDPVDHFGILLAEALPALQREPFPLSALHPLRAYLRALVAACEAAGCERRAAGRQWRTLPPTDRQLRTLSFLPKRAARQAPPKHAKLLRRLPDAPGLTRGDVSDALTVASWLVPMGAPARPWPTLLGIDDEG